MTRWSTFAGVDGYRAFFSKLVGVARQVEQRLPKAGLVGVDLTEVCL
jgi:hypothetical protein